MNTTHIAFLVTMEARRGHPIPGSGATDACKPPHGCLELNPGPLGKVASTLNHGAISPDPYGSVSQHSMDVSVTKDPTIPFLSINARKMQSLCSHRNRKYILFTTSWKIQDEQTLCDPSVYSNGTLLGTNMEQTEGKQT